MVNKGPVYLSQCENNWETDVGAWFPGEAVIYRGKDLFSEVSDLGWLGMLLYGITGRVFSETQVQLIEKIMIMASSFPDPRLWNNRVAALAGTARSTHTLGISAANAISETKVFGHRPSIKVMDFLFRVDEFCAQGGDIKEFVFTELKINRKISGYGRPLANKDERIEPLLKSAQKLNAADGRFTSLVFEVEGILSTSKYRMKANVAALAAGLLADQGVSVREFYHISWLSFLGGMFPCYQDAADKTQGSFFPISCQGLKYKGNERRTW